MNISVLNNLIAKNGWKSVRCINSSYQYMNVISGKTFTVTIRNAEDIPDGIINKISTLSGGDFIYIIRTYLEKPGPPGPALEMCGQNGERFC